MENFQSLGLPQPIMNALSALQFHTPTAIQAQVIPMALTGRDILGSAQTGTGKTAAFGIPLVAKLLGSPQGSTLVILPTRELALQVMKTLWDLLGQSRNSIKSVLLIGGEPIVKQLRQLSTRPRLIVGTPGRINDHLKRKSLNLYTTDFLVLDEADRMLDMGFTPQIDNIMKHMPTKRQTLLFSATLPKHILTMSEKYLSDPLRMSVANVTEPLANLKQDIMYVAANDKYDHLVSQLNEREGSIIVFVKTKINAEKIARRLRQENHSADAIHGDLKYNQRVRTMHEFRNEKYRIMVATDIAARGLDVAHVRHVINYDLPQCSEDYIHRIGRTARAGAEGSALCFVTPADRSQWKAICQLLNMKTGDSDHSRGDHPRGDHPRGRQNSDERPRKDTLDHYRRKSFAPKRTRDSSVFHKGPKKDDRQGGGGSSSARPWAKPDDRQGGGGSSSARPWAKPDDRQGGGGSSSARPWAKKDDRQGGGGSSSERPWTKRDDRQGGGGSSSARPWAKKDDRQGSGGSSSARPWAKKDDRQGGGGSSSARPWAGKKDGSFQKARPKPRQK